MTLHFPDRYSFKCGSCVPFYKDRAISVTICSLCAFTLIQFDSVFPVFCKMYTVLIICIKVATPDVHA